MSKFILVSVLLHNLQNSSDKIIHSFSLLRTRTSSICYLSFLILCKSDCYKTNTDPVACFWRLLRVTMMTRTTMQTMTMTTADTTPAMIGVASVSSGKMSMSLSWSNLNYFLNPKIIFFIFFNIAIFTQIMTHFIICM